MPTSVPPAAFRLNDEPIVTRHFAVVSTRSMSPFQWRGTCERHERQ
jgi:hypothetical protein